MRFTVLFIALLAACNLPPARSPEPEGAPVAGNAPTTPAPAAETPTDTPSTPAAPETTPAAPGPAAPTEPAPAEPTTPPPPPSLTVSSATLESLTAYSPALVFDTLTITGRLTLPPGRRVAIQARVFELTSTGSVSVSWSACNYSAASDFSVLATERAVIDGHVDLSGKDGETSLSEATCNSCYGSAGGSFVVASTSISLGKSGRVDTSGGWSYTSVIAVDGQVLRMPCDGADAGDVVLSATDTLSVGAEIKVAGGNAGLGNVNGNLSEGTDGREGGVMWDAEVIEVSERDPNAFLANAQPLAATALTLTGSVSTTDDGDAGSYAGSVIIRSGDYSDLVEDLFVVRNDEASPRTITVELAGADAGLDLDLIVADHTGLGLLASSTSPGATERVTFVARPGERYFIGVSLAARGNTSYRLSLR